MQFSKIPRYIYKLIDLGPQKSFVILQSRMKDRWNDTYWRYLALQQKAAHTWPEIARFYEHKSFSLFFDEISNKDFSFLNEVPKPNKVIKKADKYMQNKFDLLGSGETTFEHIDWHADFRLQQQNANADYHYDATEYYKDIVVEQGQNDQFAKDIKMPWELSRFQQTWYLAHAYKQTGDDKYAQAFKKHVASWIDANEYLLGPNWKCPMDVGIRALNWVVGFSFFNDATTIDQAFWQRFVCSLYDHMIYLENNWEIYDSRTSNHYLSDLIGYFYLCYFFSDLDGVQQKVEWCYQELLREFDKQIFDEGADYEGSTNYHQLITEIYYYFYLLAPAFGFILPDKFVAKFKRMFDFIDWCTPINGSLIHIGDNDSGIIVSGVSPKLIKTMKNESNGNVKHFPQFGLSIYKTSKWHVSLRHHAYNQRQPSGHFHNDATSVTLAIDGILLFVDPGSFIYTPSQIWRNRFRSVAVHNTFYVKSSEPVPFDDRLFALDMYGTQTPATHEVDQQRIILKTFHDHYARFGLRAQRTVACNEVDKQLLITDQWEHINGKYTSDLITGWNFTLAPTIDTKKTDAGWLLVHNRKPIAEFSSQLTFECIDGWYSPSYGKKVPCKQLRAQVPLSFDKTVMSLLILI